MSRRKTKAENIKNPEHYFNSMIKKELERDKNKTAKYHTMFISYDEITDMDSIRMNRDILLQLVAKQGKELHSGEAPWLSWFESFENETLYFAVLRLTQRQQFILYRRFYLEYSQEQIGAFLNIPQQAVSSNMRTAIKKIKKFFAGGCEKP